MLKRFGLKPSETEQMSLKEIQSLLYADKVIEDEIQRQTDKKIKEGNKLRSIGGKP